MTGPTIVTTAATPVRSCCLCGSPAVAGTGVAVARWWCLKHVDVGLHNTAADLAIVRARLRLDDRIQTFQRALTRHPVPAQRALPTQEGLASP